MIGLTALVLSIVSAFALGAFMQNWGFFGWLKKKTPWGDK